MWFSLGWRSSGRARTPLEKNHGKAIWKVHPFTLFRNVKQKICACSENLESGKLRAENFRFYLLLWIAWKREWRKFQIRCWFNFVENSQEVHVDLPHTVHCSPGQNIFSEYFFFRIFLLQNISSSEYFFRIFSGGPRGPASHCPVLSWSKYSSKYFFSG